MTDKLEQLRRLIDEANATLRAHFAHIDAAGLTGYRDSSAESEAARAAETAVLLFIAPIVREASTVDDLICLAEAARYFARVTFEGPPVMGETPHQEATSLALWRGCVQILPTVASHSPAGFMASQNSG